MTKLLFICTGNTCRSPMAEGLFNLYAEKRGLSARADSAGLYAMEGVPAEQNAVRAAAELGADIAGHRARSVTPAMLSAADRVLCMTLSQQKQLSQSFPQYAEKIGRAGEEDIPDPFGRDLEVYRHTARALTRAVRRIADALAAPPADGGGRDGGGHG